MPTAPHSETTRLEAFSDAVIAIVITIMVLELNVPEEASIEALLPIAPVFFSYVLSFLYLVIYWHNHHHLLHATEVVTGGIMWANTHLLFWLSLVPFATAWIGESHGATLPAFIYAFVLLMAAIAYSILQISIVRKQGRTSALGRALSNDLKGKVSIGCYVTALVASFFLPWISYALFALVALMWIVPDKRLAPLFDHIEDKHSHPH
jgi:uncharacterized membrane protein